MPGKLFIAPTSETLIALQIFKEFISWKKHNICIISYKSCSISLLLNVR